MRSALKFRTNFDCRARLVHSNVKLIFLAVSILAQPPQRPSSKGNPAENTGPPHFLHLVGTIITTYFIMIMCVASYKEEARCIALANQSSQNGLIFNKFR
jgi:hypothetical protein